MRILRLEPSHELGAFDSGNATLDDWLKRLALQAQRSDAATTYVALDADSIVVGYATLANGSLMPDDMALRIRKGLARNLPVPILLLARLAVASDRQGRGLGSHLLLYAMRIELDIAEKSGVRALVVNPTDDKAERFYRQFEFETLPDTAPPAMYLLTKDIRKLVAAYDVAKSRS